MAATCSTDWTTFELKTGMSFSSSRLIIGTILVAVIWVYLWLDRFASLEIIYAFERMELALLKWGWEDLWPDGFAFRQLADREQWIGFSVVLGLVGWWLVVTRKEKKVIRFLTYSLCFFPIWHFALFVILEIGSAPSELVVASEERLAKWNETFDSLTRFVYFGGCFLAFAIGLSWLSWLAEKKSRDWQTRRLALQPVEQPVGPLHAMHLSRAGPVEGSKVWDPLDMDAWYYGKQRQKLRQSTTVLVAYCTFLFLVFLLLLQFSGCKELYEMPAGGGEQKPNKPVVKVQKVIKKKIIFNPLSKVIAKVPPIEEIKLQLMEITKHAYTVGYGKGAGAGFAGGTNRGKVRFIRLEYNGGDWDQGIDADLNMLVQYNLRTQHKIASRPETRKIIQLRNFPVGKSPPVVYMTGQKNISLGKTEVDVLKEYLTEKHGMLFADNGGSAHWGNQFKSLMNRVLPNVSYIRVPLDHPIHRVPFPIPFLPYVAPHGGRDALAWVVNGRIASYYHPGDIGDAWADDHAGVPAQIWEACYQLGTNVIFYAHAEYSKWLEARKKSD